MQNILEERVHFGKWDIEFKKKRMIYDGTEIVITDLQWDILEFLMSDSELSFSIKEIAYATNIEVYEAQIYVEELLKTIKEQTGSAIVQKNERKILICGNYKLSDGEKAVDLHCFFYVENDSSINTAMKV